MVQILALSSFLTIVTRRSLNIRRGACIRAPLISMMSSKSTVPTVLTAKQALALHKSGSVKFLDGSWHMGTTRISSVEFLSERIPGAQYFDIDQVCDKSTNLPHMLPDDQTFEDAVSSMGISNDDHVVVYVHPNCFSGPRVWWMFKAFGHDKVSVLNGGLNAWKAAGGDVDCCKAVIPAERTNYKATLSQRCHINANEVLSVVNMGSAQIVDARSKGRFEGTAPEPRAGLEGGHMPGALNLPFTMLVKEDDVTSFRSAVEVRDAFKEVGVVFGSKIVLTCGSGVSASVLALGLDMLGQELQSCPIYDGSWSEWGARSDLPKMK